MKRQQWLSNKAQHKPRKQCLHYTRSLLRPILVHTLPNAHPIKGIGRAVHKDGFNIVPTIRRTLIWNGLHLNRTDGTARCDAFGMPGTLNTFGDGNAVIVPFANKPVIRYTTAKNN